MTALRGITATTVAPLVLASSTVKFLYPSLMATVLLLAACGSKKSEEPPAPITATAPVTSAADAAATAKQLFAQRCVPCHGAGGHGDGAASAQLDPKPRNYTDATWQASVTDDYIMKIIQYGGAAVGKSPAMPNNPDLTDPAVVAALKDIVRSFNKQ